MTKEVGGKIGRLFSQVGQVTIPELGSSRGRSIKIYASFNLDTPLFCGANIRFNGVSCWVDFKYEQLADFCYYCGQVGHIESISNTKRADERNNALKECQFRGW